MNKNDFTIRLETPTDHRAVENAVREAFWNVYRPGCLEHYLLHRLRTNKDFVPELDFVIELGGRIIGQAACMRAGIDVDGGGTVPVLTMGPISVLPEYQRRGYGKALLDFSLKKAAGSGAGAVCFEGDIRFYGKCGFAYASEFGIRYRGLPEGEDAPFFLCKELLPGYLSGITGEYSAPKSYLVNESEVEEFDKEFPPKQKLRRPGQLF